MHNKWAPFCFGALAALALAAASGPFTIEVLASDGREVVVSFGPYDDLARLSRDAVDAAQLGEPPPRKSLTWGPHAHGYGSA